MNAQADIRQLSDCLASTFRQDRVNSQRPLSPGDDCPSLHTQKPNALLGSVRYTLSSLLNNVKDNGGNYFNKVYKRLSSQFGVTHGMDLADNEATVLQQINVDPSRADSFSGTTNGPILQLDQDCLEQKAKSQKKLDPSLRRKEERRFSTDTFQTTDTSGNMCVLPYQTYRTFSGRHHNTATGNKDTECCTNPNLKMHTDIVHAIIKMLNEADIEVLKYALKQTDDTEQKTDSKLCKDIETKKKCANIISECERLYVNSPHVNRKLSTLACNISILEEKYMSLKTNVYEKSIKGHTDSRVGVIDISVQYLTVTERLKITINNVNNLQKTKKAADFVVNVSILGSEKQREKETKVCRGNTDVSFNSDIYFNKISMEEVHLICLTFKVKRMSKLFISKRSKCVGECFVYLDNYDVIGKVHVSEDLLAYCL